MSLSASIDIQMPAESSDGFGLRAELEVPAGTTTAVVGPNGAGKTTLLRCIAGFVRNDVGRINVGGKLVDSPGEVFVEPPGRRIGLVPQGYNLFEHMSALANVAFGLEVTGMKRAEAHTAAEAMLARVGASAYAKQRPNKLSGGQSQRVAIARAMAVNPELFLLDEPFAALDASVRPQLRSEMRRWLTESGSTALLVTHDPIDALTMADHIVVLEAGRVVQSGPTQEVASRPTSAHVARLLGTNLFQGSAVAGDGGNQVHLAQGPALSVAESCSGSVFVTIAPSAVTLSIQPPEGSARNQVRVEVKSLEQMGERIRVKLDGALPITAEITPAAVGELRLNEGSQVWASIKATEINVYPR